MQSDTRWGGLKQGHLTAQPQPVFARIELETKPNNTSDETKKVNQEEEKEMVKTQKVVEA